ncbi:MAG: putative aminoacrylate hydrolase RutD [Gemmatimonadaceae bacterium]|nr:putative aminoacrylate hydrolase RutD [Gemmatimonadaceae bacterium]
MIAAGAAGGLWYRIVGKGADTVLVPLDLYLGRSIEPLSATYTLVFYDPRGRGRSTAYRDSALTSFAFDVDDMERVRNAVGVSRMSLIGFSYFAAVAAEYAAAYPERIDRLVLLSPMEPTDSLARLVDASLAMARLDTTRARQLVRLRAAGKDTSDAAAYCRTYWAVNAPAYVGDSARAARFDASFCDLPNESIRTFAAHVARVMASLPTPRDFRTVARRVRAPALVISGQRDVVMNPDGASAWAALIPDARLLTIAGSGHMLYVDNPDYLIHALRTFLGGAWPSGAVPAR